ncbi:iron ABC transporter [Gemmatimonadetes bacterium T265]|nr:iron ABC transporter [Gemmatimonadetes bacterium T265]
MRVVSLCPSLTELVFALGRGDALVGRTKFCVHPAERVGAVEALGGTKDPKVARVVALRPDLVLLNEEENRREDAEALAAAGLRLHVSFPRDAPETAGMVRGVGEALGASGAAERIAGEIEARTARVRAGAAARAARGERPVRWAYLIWRRPWMAAGGGTFVSALLEQAGGTNVFAAAEVRYPEVTAAALRAADPNVVFLSSEPFPFAERHAEELVAETGLPRERFRFADGELLSWHGSRTVAGVDYADALLEDVRCRT